MQPDADAQTFAGLKWASNYFEAYRINTVDGTLIDQFSDDAGVTTLDREGMRDVIARLVVRWPGLSAIYASGMIGSGLGWTEVDYVTAPAGPAEVARGMVLAMIGNVPVHIVAGVACTREFDGAPDIMRGEEIELLGLAASDRDGLAVLPGAHTKWASLQGGRVTEFFSSMAGEIYGHLIAQGLLSSVTSTEVVDGEAFLEGVEEGRCGRLSLGTTLFGVRARVMRGHLAVGEASSYLRGLLIGSELADAQRLFPHFERASIAVIGDGSPADLYGVALRHMGAQSTMVDPHAACLAGFVALHRKVSPSNMIPMIAGEDV